jgi:hypothetical protein
MVVEASIVWLLLYPLLSHLACADEPKVCVTSEDHNVVITTNIQVKSMAR